MKRLAYPLLAIALIACGVSFLAPPSAAQDGPVRQWLKQRQQQKAAPDASTDTATPITRPGDYRFTIQHGGQTRMYRVHVPTGYDPATAAPLLVAMHGGGGNMDYQANDTYYGQITQSDRRGFVAVFPNGFSKRRNGWFATWNAGNCCGDARDQNIDDVGFIRQVVTNITRQMNIDRSRVYATGMSNGGMMAYRLACEMPDVFSAIAAVAGTDNTRSCTPRSPVSILHIHARDDGWVQFTGGAGPDTRDISKVTDFTSVAASVAKWARLNGCPATPQRSLEKPGAFCELYSPCRDQARVQLCVTDSGGHSWPGGVKPRGGEPSQAISANDVMWDFFDRR